MKHSPSVPRHLSLRSIDQLDPILDCIADKALTSTSIVKSQPIKRRPPGIGRRGAGGKAAEGANQA
ncbi:hypothetical protein [Pseudomonas benzenivorans]|uniref:hypothetical protein n=1 Tax=Pseudomonas benzenivorans TaxID=556533 RepID=UPI002102FB33|nr:hypothetical protein [Pseudomonas benzenivorans]